MMDIRFGKCEHVNGARIRVTIPGYSGDAGFDCLLMQPCASGPAAWLPPAEGDVVVVAVDQERLENSVVLGAVYPDAVHPPKTKDTQAALAYDEVYLGKPVPETKIPRDDHVQAELSAIRSELDKIKTAFSAHVHALPPMVAGEVPVAVIPTGTGPGNTGAAPTYDQGYSVGETATDCVWGK